MPIVMKILGYDGSSTTPGYKGWIDLGLFSWGKNRRHPEMDILITKSSDALSNVIYRKCIEGTSFREIKVHFLDDALNPTTKVQLDEVMVTSVSYNGRYDGTTLEEITLSAEKLTWES